MKKIALTLSVLSFATLALACGGLEEKMEALAAQGQIEMEAGATLGVSTDQDGCLSTTLDRSAGCTGSIMEQGTCRGMAQVYLQGCLGTAAESAGFCDGAPSQSEIMETVNYGIDRCEAAGRGGEESCANLMQTRAQWCNGE